MFPRLTAFTLLLASCVGLGCQGSTNPSTPTPPSTPTNPTPPKPVPPGEPKQQPRTVDEVRDAYLKALDAKDYAAMEALADVPWLDTNREVVRSRDELPKAIKRAASQMPAARDRKLETFAYKKLQPKIQSDADRKLLDDVVGEDGMLVVAENGGFLFENRVLLIRVKDGVARVVSGPLKDNQLEPRNVISEPVQKMFDKSDSFELLSLNPSPNLEKDKEKPDPKKELFHGYTVLGKLDVKSAEDRKKLVDSLRQGAEDNPGAVAGCFKPRHGIRMKAGDSTVDLVICFECLSVQVYIGDKRAENGFLTTGDPQEVFDAVLKAADVKLAESATKEP